MSFSCFDNSNYDYNALANKPCVNGKTLIGDMSFEDMGIIETVECITQAYAECCIYPTVDCCLCSKQDNLTPGLGICLDQDSNISVAPDNVIDNASENAVMNCTVSSALSAKQDTLVAGASINITCCMVSVCVDCAMSQTSTNPVMNCVINNAIDCIMSCGYAAGNGICMCTDSCGTHVISLDDNICVCCDLLVNGCTELKGPLLVCGDIFQCGSAYCTHAEEVFSKCDCLHLRDGNSSPLAPGEHSGFVVEKYDGTNDAIIDVDSTGTWRLGETDGDPHQAIATRADSCCMCDKGLAVWNGSCCCFDTASATWDDAIEPHFSCSCTPSYSTIKGEAAAASQETVRDYQSFSDLEHDISCEQGGFSRTDRVVGISNCVALNDVPRHLWSQCSCCVEYSTLADGCACCPKDIVTFTRDMSTGMFSHSVNAECVCYDSIMQLCVCMAPNCGECCHTVDCLLCDEMQQYTATMQCTRKLVADVTYIPNTSGSVEANAYSSGDFTNLPSVTTHCVSCLCYYLDDLNFFCDQCCYYCYDTGSDTYCYEAVTAETYVPCVYYFSCECACVETSSMDFCVADGACTVTAAAASVLCCCGTEWSALADIDFMNSAELSSPIATCCMSADTRCRLWDFKCEICSVNAKVWLQTAQLDICEESNGRQWLVQTCGDSSSCVVQSRNMGGAVEERDQSCSQWSDWSSGASPLFTTNCGVCDAKAIALPYGLTQDTGSLHPFRVIFTQGHQASSLTDYMTLNSIPIVSSQNGTLANIPVHELSSGVYSVLDANTVLELYYTATGFAGNPAFVAIGNPVVLSSSDYTIYADGKVGDTSIGTVQYTYEASAPYGWLFLRGQTLSRTTYKRLWDWANDNGYVGSGKPFGVGDGSTTFVLPNLGGEFIRAAGANSHSNQGAGASVGRHQDSTVIYPSYWNGNGGAGGNQTDMFPEAGENVKNNDSFIRDTFYAMNLHQTGGYVHDIMNAYTVRPTNTSLNIKIKAM